MPDPGVGTPVVVHIEDVGPLPGFVSITNASWTDGMITAGGGPLDQPVEGFPLIIWFDTLATPIGPQPMAEGESDNEFSLV